MNIKTERYGVRGMGKRMGSEKLGSFYTGKRQENGVNGAV